jgi:hypothetical protein
MNTDPDFEVACETSRLLSELDQAIDHSSAIRAIVKRREQLHELERLTGPSVKTRKLRKEIWIMEQQLRAERAASGISRASLLPA